MTDEVRGIHTNSYSGTIIASFGLSASEKRVSTFSFSSTTQKPYASSWKAYVFDSVNFLFYLIEAPGGRVGDVKTLASGIKAENFILLVHTADESCLLVIRSLGKTKGNQLIVPIKTRENVERVTGAIRKLNFTSDALTAQSSILQLSNLLKEGAERFFTNRGLFSTYYLRERLFPSLKRYKKNAQKETEKLLSKLGGEIKWSHDLVKKFNGEVKRVEGVIERRDWLSIIAAETQFNELLAETGVSNRTISNFLDRTNRTAVREM